MDHLAPKRTPPQGHRDERYLKHFDLAAGGVQVLHILSALILFEGVDLDAERYALLSAMLPRCELCAYAVHLTTTTTNTQLHHDPEQLYRLYNKGHKQCVCVCARITSHLYEYRRMFGNIPQKLSSIKLGRVGAGFGNTHTHRDIYNKYETLRDFINQHISGKDSKISHSVSKMYQCRGDGRQGDSTSSLPAADAPCTAASGHETQLSLYSTHTDAQIIAAVFLVCIEQPNICNVDC